LNVDGISGCGDLRLLVANGCFSTGDLGLLAGELGLKTLAGDFDQRRRQRFRQFRIWRLIEDDVRATVIEERV